MLIDPKKTTVAFRCPVCGSIMKAPKAAPTAKTPKGHRKPLWCYLCKKKTLHVQISK
jgi:predicted RNA-binding Zn-ribbon protein involved in translation (DUF1610 family)